MKFIGVIKEYEPGLIKIGKSIKDIFISKSDSNLKDFEKISSYLDSGKILIAFLHYVNDEMGNPIEPLILYTDGKWIWPSYLKYYLSRNCISLLEDEFVADLKANNFIVPYIDKEKMKEAERFYKHTYSPR